MTLSVGTTILTGMLAASPASAWYDRLGGTAHTGSANAVAVDASGAVIAAGRLDDGDTGGDLAVAKLDGASGALLWRHVIDGGEKLGDVATSVAVDTAGDVIVAGSSNDSPLTTIPFPAGSGDFTVLKLSGATGEEQWRSSLNLGGSAGALSLALDPSGGVVAAGEVQFPLTHFLMSLFVVARFDASDGAEQWTKEISGSFAPAVAAATAVAVDGGGNALASGYELEAGFDGSFLVVKLAAADGSILWRTPLAGTAPGGLPPGPPNVANAIALAAGGDAIAAGTLFDTTTASDFAVVRLAAANGVPLWLTALDGGDSGDDTAYAVALDAGGDVVAAGQMRVGGADRAAVVKLAGGTGGEAWRWTGAAGSLRGLRLDGAGDVLATGRLTGVAGTGFAIVKLRGSDGVELWRTALGDGGADDQASAVALAAGGDPVAAGRATLGSETRFAVARLAAADGAQVDAGVPVCGGGPLLLRPHVKIKRRMPTDPAAITFDGALSFVPGTPAGFDPAAHGAQLLIEDLGSGGAAVFDSTTRTSPIPPGARGSGCGKADGWLTSARSGRSTYVNRSGALAPPACPAGSANGLRALKLVDRRASDGEIRFSAGVRSASAPAITGPLRATIWVDAGSGAGEAGACGAFVFLPGACVVTAGGKTLDCR